MVVGTYFPIQSETKLKSVLQIINHKQAKWVKGVVQEEGGVSPQQAVYK